ncbi:MAG TPA: CoA pyrophosphatase [Ktedonobacterales bacterium]
MIHDKPDQALSRTTLLADAEALAAYLRRRLAEEPFATAESEGHLVDIDQAARQARAAAVLAPLYSLEGRPHLLFTRRSADLTVHKGEISFPGGSRDPTDNTLEQTALRETYEELGLAPASVEVIGALPPVLAAVSNFFVTPFVGWLGEGLLSLHPNPHEVAEVIEAPLQALADPAIYHAEQWRRNGMAYTIHFYDFGAYRIWGLTGRMLRTLLNMLPPE